MLHVRLPCRLDVRHLSVLRGYAVMLESLRYECICATTAAPSPTADATRLVEPPRTSPMAKTPGRLVCKEADACAAPRAPVSTYPLSSRSTQPSSHAVFGSAPMNMKSCRTGSCRVVPDTRSRIVTPARLPTCSPCREANSEPTTMSTLPSALIRSMRYRDIEASSPLPLTIIVRRLTWDARYTAACPAELPAPTKAISSPSQSLASAGDAQ